MSIASLRRSNPTCWQSVSLASNSCAFSPIALLQTISSSLQLVEDDMSGLRRFYSGGNFQRLTFVSFALQLLIFTVKYLTWHSNELKLATSKRGPAGLGVM